MTNYICTFIHYICTYIYVNMCKYKCVYMQIYMCIYDKISINMTSYYKYAAITNTRESYCCLPGKQSSRFRVQVSEPKKDKDKSCGIYRSLNPKSKLETVFYCHEQPYIAKQRDKDKSCRVYRPLCFGM